MKWEIHDWRDEGEIHIVPTDKKHERVECWCGPEIRTLKQILLYIHFVQQ